VAAAVAASSLRVLPLPVRLFAEAASPQQPEQHPLAGMNEQEAVQYLNAQYQMAMSMPPGSAEKIQTLRRLHELVPDNLGIAVKLGLEVADTPEGIRALETCYDPTIMKHATLPGHDVDMAWRLANFIGRCE